ncbi:flavin-dependent oxidoreductase [Alphaproteobacteria bacterium]|jgi:2-polyprenyl-6-methoxyphenol hydroxylase-like FAD-dependent oxidoreductase|nr:flavin-dependent oxidoreductase [Alphaproteobacteria bacterium]
MTDKKVIIAGGGIGGLTLALTLHQIGVPFLVLETSHTMRPLGVGINIQPNAVREFFELGLTSEVLGTIGVPAKEWALVGLNGREVYSEKRGLDAGYNWPQFAAHRGELLMLLYRTLIERAGAESVMLDARVDKYLKRPSGEVDVSVRGSDGSRFQISGRLLIGADGIHSAVRAQMHPDQPPIHWGGAIMWRGTVRAKPLRTESSFIGLGTHQHRMVIYPISKPAADGTVLTNWIAELTVDRNEGWLGNNWFKEVPIESFAHHFESFRYDWLDVPTMLNKSECGYMNPMIDRDPVATWVDGPVALMGDAAHAMYPTGSNGASQAIVDARVIGAAILTRGLTPDALKLYDNQLCKKVSELVLRNRLAGPFGLLDILNDRCGGVFENIDTIIPLEERNEFMSKYKAAAGFAIEALNEAPQTIPSNAKFS